MTWSEIESHMYSVGDYLDTSFSSSPVMVFVLLFFFFNQIIAVIEIGADLVNKKQRRWKDTLANIFTIVVDAAIKTTVLGVISVAVLIPFTLLQVYQIPLNGWTWLAALFVADFLYYVLHRIEHTYRILWALHVVHHSSEDLNLTIPYRMSWLQDYFEWVILVPMVIMGFDIFQSLVCFILVSQYQNWLHTERIGKMGILDEVINTPSLHRVHHSSAKQHLDKNFGGVLMIWDKLFGTFERENEKIVYGITKNINTNNPFKINFIEFKLIWDDVKKCRTFRDKLKTVFGPLNSKPDYL